jgi:hypothetical protein
MLRRKWLIVGVLLVTAVVMGAIGILTWDRTQTLSAATSPDGAWSVAVIAKPHVFTGSYDIVVQVRDKAGNPMPGAFVIDLTHDLANAERRHAVRFIDAKTAKVGERTVVRGSYLQE